MKYLKTIIKYIAGLFDEAGITEKEAGLLVAGSLAAIVLAFVICAIGIAIGGGRFNAIAKKAGKRLMQDDTTRFKDLMNKLPTAQKVSWDAYRKTRVGLPSAAFPPATCLTAGFNASMAAAATTIVALVSVLASTVVVLGCAASFADFFDPMSLVAMTICPMLGSLFTLIIFICSRIKYASVVKNYDKFCALIDAKYHKPDAVHSEPSYSASFAQPEPPVFNQQEAQPEPVASFDNGNDEYNERFNNAADNFNTFTDDDDDFGSEPVVMGNTRPVSQPVNSRPVSQPHPSLADLEDDDDDEPIVATRPAPEPMPEPEPIIMATPTPEPASEPIIMPEPEPMPEPELEPEPVVEENIIDRIDRMLAEGASTAQIKEVARQLQVERAKPENRNPEQTRKLNDALARLVKAMSNARK